MFVAEGEVQEFLPGYDALCIATDIFPDHVYAQFDAVRLAAENAITRIGEPARRAEFDALRVVDGEVSTGDTKEITANATERADSGATATGPEVR